jgi:all-trans-8'-apo-beta-carotenal 15,15'-oxygenase
MVTRRESLSSLGAGGMAALLGGANLARADARALTPPLSSEHAWLKMLTQNVETENDYVPTLEGALPRGLAGTVYRNGPGLFERNGFNKETLFDGQPDSRD